MKLQELDFSVVHRSGKQHQDADFLSRHPIEDARVAPVLTLLDLQSVQAEECDTFNIIQLLSDEVNGRPRLSERRLRRLRTYYQLRDGLLCHRAHPSGAWLPVVPPKMRRNVLEMCHDAPTAGHLGQHRTLDKVAKRFWWPHLRTDVRQYVASCATCQPRKTPPHPAKTELQQIPPPGSPFEVVGIDHLGPFPKSDDGNRYVIVATDYLTKWVEVEAVPDTSAVHLVTFVNKHLVLRHGTPRLIISDRGTSFMSRTFGCALRDYGIEHAAASPYHPQTNGLVERTNRSIGDILAAFVNKSHKNWDMFIGTAAFALNTSQQEVTAKSPFELVYGRLPTLPQESSMGAAWTRRAREYEENFAERLSEARKLARLAILNKQSKLAERHNRDTSLPSFSPGDVVLLRRHLRRSQHSEKLLPRYCGPFKISRQLGPVTYRLENLDTLPQRGRRRTLTAHSSHLKLYVPRGDYLSIVRDGLPNREGRV